MQRVAVVGAGVIGSSAALHLAERFSGALDLTVFSEKFSERSSPKITSGKAGAILVPPHGGHQGSKDQVKSTLISPRNANISDRAKTWSKATLKRFNSIYKSEENAEVQLCLQQGYALFESPVPDPWYKDDVFGFRHVKLDSAEASLIHVPPDCVDVWAFSTYIVEMTNYLAWLMEQTQKRGAKYEQRKINSFDELSSYDIIVNCTGLGSCDLLGDKLLHPVRGQAVLTDAPWMKQWLIFFGKHHLSYIFPRAKNVLLGSTAQAGNWNETPEPKTAEVILERCQKYFPSLRGADIIDSWAGLRPLRDPIRLDSCDGPAGSLLVNCYGHGGQGMILSWGSAVEIGNIVQERLASNNRSEQVSAL